MLGILGNIFQKLQKKAKKDVKNRVIANGQRGGWGCIIMGGIFYRRTLLGERVDLREIEVFSPLPQKTSKN